MTEVPPRVDPESPAEFRVIINAGMLSKAQTIVRNIAFQTDCNFTMDVEGWLFQTIRLHVKGTASNVVRFMAKLAESGIGEP